MVEKRLGNTAGSTASASYTLGEDCGSATLSMSSTVSWMSATASNGTISITATDGNTGGERNGYIIPIVNGEECSNNKIKVTQEAGEEPSTDCTCLVDNCAETGDLHEAELESSAGITCDSALANNPDNYAFEVTYSQTSGGPWTTKSGDDNWLTPAIVARAGCIKGPTKQADYSYLENTTGSERWAKVHWTWSKDKEEGMCDYSDAYFVQEAGGGGGGGCEMSITIAGLPSGEEASVSWGSEKTEPLGNGTHNYTSTHSSLNVSVTKEGWSFNPSSANLSCGGTPSASFTGSKGCNGCDSSLVLNPTEITADPTGGTYTIEYTCCKELVLEGGGDASGMFTTSQTYNSTTQKGVVSVVCVGNDTQNSKTGYVLFKNDHTSTECAKTKITQDKKGDIPKFTKQVKFNFVMENEFVNTFLVDFYIRKKSDNTNVYRIEHIGADNQSCNRVSQYSETVDIDAECPDGIENYYIWIHVINCLGYKTDDCSRNDGKTHDYFHDGTQLSDQSLRIDDLNNLRSEETFRSRLKS